jgi:hypothetical protein
MLLLIAAAFTTQGLGIHCFFGAFVMGLITPKEGGFAEGIADRMELVTGESFQILLLEYFELLLLIRLQGSAAVHTVACTNVR